jgi:hypothetical protein
MGWLSGSVDGSAGMSVLGVNGVRVLWLCVCSLCSWLCVWWLMSGLSLDVLERVLWERSGGDVGVSSDVLLSGMYGSSLDSVEWMEGVVCVWMTWCVWCPRVCVHVWCVCVPGMYVEESVSLGWWLCLWCVWVYVCVWDAWVVLPCVRRAGRSEMWLGGDGDGSVSGDEGWLSSLVLDGGSLEEMFVVCMDTCVVWHVLGGLFGVCWLGLSVWLSGWYPDGKVSDSVWSSVRVYVCVCRVLVSCVVSDGVLNRVDLVLRGRVVMEVGIGFHRYVYVREGRVGGQVLYRDLMRLTCVRVSWC